jgi:hypothetical protein
MVAGYSENKLLQLNLGENCTLLYDQSVLLGGISGEKLTPLIINNNYI